MFSRRRGDSRATTCRPLIATALLTPSSALEDNLLNSSADPRKAPNEIISLDRLIRAHTTAGSFVCNRKRHVPHPQTHIFIILYTNMHFYTHPHPHVQTTQHDRFFVRYSYYYYCVCIHIYMPSIILLTGRTGPFHTFRPSDSDRPPTDTHYIVCALVVNKMIVLNRRTRPYTLRPDVLIKTTSLNSP